MCCYLQKATANSRRFTELPTDAACVLKPDVRHWATFQGANSLAPKPQEGSCCGFWLFGDVRKWRVSLGVVQMMSA